jgi:hypothetical protein
VKDGRRFSRPPNTYTPPSDTDGSVNLSDAESRVVRALRGFIQDYNAQDRHQRARARRGTANRTSLLHAFRTCTGTRPSSVGHPRHRPLGTETTLSAQIDAKRMQFADIELVRIHRENPLKCRDSAAVREIPVHD